MLTTVDFVDAANGLRPQLALMEGAKESVAPDAVGSAIAGVIDRRLGGAKLVRGGSLVGTLQLEAPPEVVGNGNHS